ncbi:MAG: hypothetical protein HKN88_09045 [Gammaproteobacteria bacterium]|nr:hypothetical protein [Gammaproteobacteria bacterium]NNC98201.1 hypothetical protein [Gammaproteobacteria bacterium]NNM14851.1 hypothetical protein [Gammaproteobacteria bacterium]
MRVMTAALLCACSFTLLACANMSKEEQGTIAGAVIGGVIGGELGEDNSKSTRNWKILAGAVIGGYIGGRIGENMDETDRLKAGHVLENNRTGHATSWVNPDSSSKYTMTPTNTYDSASGPCREYTMDAMIGGKRDTVYGTACRQSDGSWQIVN